MKKNGNIKSFIGLIVLILVVLAFVLLYDRGDGEQRADTGQGNATEEVKAVGEPEMLNRVMVGVPTPLQAADIAYLYDEETGDLKQVEQPEGWRVTEIQESHNVQFEPVFNDPSVTRFLLNDSWDVVLRNKQAAAYQNPTFLGLVDDSTVALQAELDGRFILFVGKDGEILEVYELPELFKVHGVYDGSVWLTTAILGEGLESDPEGPADVVRINRDEAIILQTEEQLIDQLIAHDSDSYAYRFSDGAYKARKGNFLWEGNGTPLLWLNEEELLVSQGSSLKKVHLTDSAQDTIGDLEAPASVADYVEFVSE